VGWGGGANWLFPIVHLFATVLEALFCTGCVVLVYQLCLRWFGRERLDSLMTVAQVIVSIAAIAASQILPQMAIRSGHLLSVDQISWWIDVLPPAWFAGVDDALAGSRLAGSWVLAALALAATALVLWLAFGKLAQNYETGMQMLNETVSPTIKHRGGRRWLDRLVELPPLSWWLREPVCRASFLLTAAYLMRDRDVKLRVYPGLAPVLVLPVIFLLRNSHQDAAVFPGVPFAGAYLGMVPLLGMQLLQFSQQWQAAEVFRAAPMAGPVALADGARRAVLCFLMGPILVLTTLIVWFMTGDVRDLLLLLPGLLTLPVFSLIPMLGGRGIPLSQPIDAAKAAGRGFKVIGVMMLAFCIAGLSSVTWSHGWFGWLLVGEAGLVAALYVVLRIVLRRTPWPQDERDQ
jgi:hypothetical protein